MAFYLIRWIRREILLAKPKEKILSVRAQRTLQSKNIVLGRTEFSSTSLVSFEAVFEPIVAVVLFNLFFLFVLYSTDHTLRHQATFTLRRILGYHEENVIYEKVIQGKAIGMKKHWKIKCMQSALKLGLRADFEIFNDHSFDSIKGIKLIGLDRKKSKLEAIFKNNK